MHGNVWEWCDGWYGDYADRAGEGTRSGLTRLEVLVACAWDARAENAGSAFRGNNYPWTRDYNLGFRVGLSF